MSRLRQRWEEILVDVYHTNRPCCLYVWMNTAEYMHIAHIVIFCTCYRVIPKPGMWRFANDMSNMFFLVVTCTLAVFSKKGK